MVESGASMTAGVIIEMIKAEGTSRISLVVRVGPVGWRLRSRWMGTLFFFSPSPSFIVALEFVSTFNSFLLSFLERPIRSFELVTDVQASWTRWFGLII